MHLSQSSENSVKPHHQHENAHDVAQDMIDAEHRQSVLLLNSTDPKQLVKRGDTTELFEYKPSVAMKGSKLIEVTKSSPSLQPDYFNAGRSNYQNQMTLYSGSDQNL